jgi:mono/diheme cytochrome c family protein
MKVRLLTLLSLSVVGALLIAACASSAPTPTAKAMTPGAEKFVSLVGDASKGKDKFTGTCSACHGPDAKGLPSLGKDLTTSTFAKGLTDAEMIHFVTTGRDPSDPLNTTGVQMPPRGGNPALTDQDLADIVAYVRTLEH